MADPTISRAGRRINGVTRPRQCFFIPVDQFDENGYIPSLVTEGEAGHAPLKGRGRCATPWYWGETYEQAKVVAESENRRQFGISQREAADIVLSSLAVSSFGGRRR